MSPQRKPVAVKLEVLVVGLTMVAIALSGCQQKAVRPQPSQSPVAAPSQPDVAGAVRYHIDSAASEVHILVYRSGSMARMGHNHVVSSKSVTGTLQLHQDITRSQLSLSLPIASLVVDDPQARATEGDDFTAVVPPEAREGTYRNLMRPEVLDVEHFPEIKLQSIAVSGTSETPSLLMRVTIKDVARDVVVLTEVDDDGKRLVTEGEFSIQQTDFGIKPFSVALGALQVQDKLRIKFRLQFVH